MALVKCLSFMASIVGGLTVTGLQQLRQRMCLAMQGLLG